MVLDDHPKRHSASRANGHAGTASRASGLAGTVASSAGVLARLRGELPYAALVRGRERVRGVLEPHLGPQHALERANNIVQALAFDDLEPQRVAFEMLRQLPDPERLRLASLVQRAWLSG